MGVPGLWEILRPAAEQRALTDLAVTDGFEANPGGRRGLRVGIDASIWFFHAEYGKEGENPELRTLFFRCARLMGRPFLPLFVFDGPKRPAVKRKKRISKIPHWLTQGMQLIIEAFGFEWRTAPGEAEAELAFLNRIGVIDAIISDDVDNFLFDARMVIRNPSKTLSGNRNHPMKNSAGKEDDAHVQTFTASNIRAHPDIGLSVGGCILIALLRGGDYDDKGLAQCGVVIAHGLAKCGFGDTLLNAARALPRDRLEAFLVNWRHEVRTELKTNASGHLGSKRVALAKALPDDFPDIDILLAYTHPITSESEGRAGKIDYKWNREPDLGRIAGICELKFEWGVKEIIVKRFRTVTWAPAVLRILRHAVLDLDERAKSGGDAPSTPRKKGKAGVRPPGTPSAMITKHFSSLHLHSPRHDSGGDEDDDDEERLIVKIHSKRKHASTDGILEYRLEIAPAQLVRLTEAGVTGVRPPIENGNDSDFEDDDDDGDGDGDGKAKKSKKPPPDPKSHIRVWMPACMVRLVEPELVEAFESGEEKKRMKKADAAARREQKLASKASAPTTPDGKKVKKAPRKKTALGVEREEEEEEVEDFSDVFGLKRNAVGRPGKSVRRMPAHAEEETEASADEDDSRPPPNLKSRPPMVNGKPKARSTGALPCSKPAKTARTASSVQHVKKPSSTTTAVPKPHFVDISDSEEENVRPAPALPSRVTSHIKTTPTKAIERTASHVSPILNVLSKLSTTDKSPPQKSQEPFPATATQPERSTTSNLLRPFPMSFSDSEDEEDDFFGAVARAKAAVPQRQPAAAPSSTNGRLKASYTRASRSSESDGWQESRVTKSPRKSTDHTSPRKTRVAAEDSRRHRDTLGKRSSDDELTARRPGSPSPLRTRSVPNASAAAVTGTSVPAKAALETIASEGVVRKGRSEREKGPCRTTELIEISSDSDSPVLRSQVMSLPPLLLAKARAKANSKTAVGKDAGRKMQGKDALRDADVNVRTREDDIVIDLT